MSCLIDTGRGYFCQGQVGGIKKIYLANWYDDNKITNIVASNGVVSDMTTASALDFFEFELDRQTSSFTQTINTGAGGALNYEQALDLHMSHDSNSSWDNMQDVVESIFQMIVLDNNGVYYLVGMENGIGVTGGTFAHGGDVAFSDYVGYVLQMVGSEKFPAFNLTTNSPFKAWTTGELTLSSTQYKTPQQ